MNVRDEVLKIAEAYLTKVRQSGSDEIRAICPFHRKPDGNMERRPSFYMSLSKGLYFCHACLSKGNLFTLLRSMGLTHQQIELHHKITLEEVKRNLPPAPDPREPGVTSLDPIPEALLGLFDFCPTNLLERGFTKETLRSFDIGYDRWNQRVTYPLRDIKGQLIGISGRSITDDWPKYKIYDEEYPTWELPARLNWDKRVVLWNAHNVYTELLFKRGGYIVVVEGFKACMWVHQAGISNVVALLGTWLSWEQQWILERLGVPVYLFLDNNEPGQAGTVKAADKLMKSLPVYIMEYPERILELPEPEAAQPDWLVAEEVLQMHASAKTYVHWLNS
jgi:DNA primase